MNDLLFEIGTEEIPAGYIRPALTHLTELLESGLAEKRLEPKEIITAGTPRRLMAWVNGVPDAQPAARKEIPGPPAKVAFDDGGKPTNAAKGFARAQKVSVEDLITRETDKGKYVFAVLE
ncbi:MAG: glycine--tRNA ligase subunit beta, partial [Planctomycetes bacterium]|nr:glycine--tRNA ligase subunit beta [Planctomycetota bacterium]